MALPVLVTISGMVGSGKSSGEGQILKLLRREGVRAESWRFRTLPCFSLPSRRATRRAGTAAPRPARAVRGRGYGRKKLTLQATAGYVARMMAFRVYRRWRGGSAWAVCNRYFYDNLAHFELDAPAARWYVALLRRCMPRPDLAILFVASPGTIAERRPLYAPDYLQRVGDAYRSLALRFPELVVVNSDPGGGAHKAIEQFVVRLLRPPASSRPR